MQYRAPFCAMLEVGWKRERIKWKDNILNKRVLTTRIKDLKLEGGTVYAHVGFDF